MISIISPAKSMDFNSEVPCAELTNLPQNSKTNLIISKLQSLSQDQIAKIMGVSTKIAELNYQRFQNFENLPEKQALFAYTGDVYKNIDSFSFTNKELQFAQKHLRIASALYGLVSPLDKIKAYRLEMVSKLSTIAPKGMAKFWQEHITTQLNLELQTHKNDCLVNLASNEYSAAINPALLNFSIINIHFREIRNGSIKNIALNSKRARGMLADYIIRNAINSPNAIKSFNSNNYNYDLSMSDDNNFFFTC
jgi:cytoplasmic iron level regulating protein YaaA (DUF328/UPF0246 family)